MSKQLKPNKKDTLPYHFVVLDTETIGTDKQLTKNTKSATVINAEEHTLSFGWALYNRKKSDGQYKRVEDFYFTTMEELTEWLDSKAHKNYPLPVFAHNMSFDYRICVDSNRVKSKGYDLGFSVFENQPFIVNWCKALSKDKGKNKMYKTLKFISTTNFFQTSLKNLGEMLGFPKGDLFDKGLNYAFYHIKHRTKVALDYGFRDVEVLEKIILLLIEFMRGKCQFSYTIASMSFNLFRHTFYKGNIEMHNDPYLQEFERSAYFGGRVELFRYGDFEDIYELDINSMYPFLMKEFPYPVGLAGYLQHGCSVKKLRELMEDYLVIAKVKVNTDEPKIPKKGKPFENSQNDKLFFPVGQFETTLCQPELNLLRDNEIVKIEEVTYYYYDYLFTEFIDYYYKLRQEYGSKGNEIMKYFCKIVLNSLYGKFAQRNRQFERKPEFDGEQQFGEEEIMETGQKIRYYWGLAYELLNSYEYGRNTFIPISAFVTSYSRSYLWKLFTYVWEHLYYTDTDSFFVDYEGYKIMKDNNFIDKDKLGYLDLEVKIKNLSLRDCKDYSFTDAEGNVNNSIKGIKKSEVKNLDFKTCQNKTEWNLKRFTGFKESMLYYNGKQLLIQETKHLKRKHDKRIISGSWTYPIKLEEWSYPDIIANSLK